MSCAIEDSKIRKAVLETEQIQQVLSRIIGRLKNHIAITILASYGAAVRATSEPHRMLAWGASGSAPMAHPRHFGDTWLGSKYLASQKPLLPMHF